MGVREREGREREERQRQREAGSVSMYLHVEGVLVGSFSTLVQVGTAMGIEVSNGNELAESRVGFGIRNSEWNW